MPPDGSSVWVPGTGRNWPSCRESSGRGIRADAAGMCVDATGRPDPTSIVVDMESLGDRTGCFAWVTDGYADGCGLDLRRVRRIEFDVDLTQCEGLWAAPIWMSPLHWIAPQGLSGEVDFVELCPVPRVATNLGCYSQEVQAMGAGHCIDAQQWADASGLGDPKHLVMTLEDSSNVGGSGNLDVLACNIDGSNCKNVAHYTNYLNEVYPTRGQKPGGLFEFRSDVWNGDYGDNGWWGCGGRRNTDTRCKFAVKNIRVSSSDGQPVFHGRCAAMNA